LPALEAMMAAVLRVAPPTVRTVEIVTQSAAFSDPFWYWPWAVDLSGVCTGHSPR